jgi:hypothetical protein
MKRLAMTVMATAGLILTSVLARPAQPASADLCDDTSVQAVADVLGIYYTAVPLGVVICGGPGLGITGTGTVCQLTDVNVNVASNGNHDYQFGLVNGTIGSCAGIQVGASYNPSTQHADEKLTGPNGLVEATWTCSDDPWIFAAGQVLTCTNVAAQAQPNDQGLDLSHSVLPFSVQFLVDSERHVLNAQLQNALKEAAQSHIDVNASRVTTSPICITCIAAAQDSGSNSIPVLPDFTITRITAEQPATLGFTGVYDVVMANLGAHPSSQVQIEIQVTGSLLYTGMAQVPSGFTCTGNNPVICVGPLGGYGDPPITTSATFKVQAYAAAPGLGAISATADPNNVMQESNENNNGDTLSVTVK